MSETMPTKTTPPADDGNLIFSYLQQATSSKAFDAVEEPAKPNPSRCSQTPNSTCAAWPGTRCATPPHP